MKKRKHSIKLSLHKKTLLPLTSGSQQAIAGGLTQYSTCCGSLPQERQTACCSQVSCDIKNPC